MKNDLKDRTKRFALAIIDVVEKLPNTISGRAVGNQLVRSGTSVASNYRAASRGRSDKEFVAKIGVVIEEADESEFWLEVINEKKWVNVDVHIKEANELTAIFVSIALKMKNRNSKNR
ncbi:four helix bundle protein [Shivajiella indica]|uniref:Four helix bundle protein n=1 Tax=Shivajiella indica TaxID=872115 RepID=A0ABW5B6Z5_9BACT